MFTGISFILLEVSFMFSFQVYLSDTYMNISHQINFLNSGCIILFTNVKTHNIMVLRTTEIRSLPIVWN